MKQVKFFLVALMAVVMGVSVTSCMNGDDNSGPRTLSVIAKLDSYGSNFKMIDGTKLVPTDPTSIMLLNSGMYIVNGQYNVEDVNVNAASITFTLTSTPTNIDGPSVTSTPDDADATMYALNYENTYYPYFFEPRRPARGPGQRAPASTVHAPPAGSEAREERRTSTSTRCPARTARGVRACRRTAQNSSRRNNPERPRTPRVRG